jgi:hypothetical protein
VSRLKNISRPAWLVIGIVVTLVAVPTAAAAVTSAVFIKGGTGPGEANVTANHQLLTNSVIQGATGNEASVDIHDALNTSINGVNHDGNGRLSTSTAPTASTVQSEAEVGAFGANNIPVVTAFTPNDMVITSLDVDADGLAGGRSQILLSVDAGTTCPLFFIQAIDSSSYGTTEITYPTGLVIPAGDSLCADQNVPGADAIITAFGYNIPTGTEAGPVMKTKGLRVPPRH